MYYDYYSIEHFMREHQRELLVTAQLERRSSQARRGRRLPLPVRVLASIGRTLVLVGQYLEHRAAAAARTAAARLRDDQRPAVQW